MPPARNTTENLQAPRQYPFQRPPLQPAPESVEVFTVRVSTSARSTLTHRQLLPLRILAARVMLGQYSAEDIAILERVDGLLQHNYGLIKAARTQRENAQKAAETVDQQAQRKEDDLRLDRQRLHEAQIAEATAHQVEINMLQQNYLAFSNAFGIIGIAAAPPSPSPDRRVAPPLSHTCLVEEDIC